MPAHCPWTQVWSTQAPASAHCPFDEHDSTALSVHCTVPAVHVPTHAPLTHVWSVHGDGSPHSPASEQTMTKFPEHLAAVGWHCAVPSQTLANGGPHVALEKSQTPRH